jgi:hypothetical protein
MVKTAQSKIGLTTLFVVIVGFIPNSDMVQSRGHCAQTELSDLLDRASKRVEEYRLLFKDLTAEETKTTEVFNRRGEVTEKKVVLSDFFVYQSRFNEQAIYEYAPSSYGITAPKRIVVDLFLDSWREKDGARRLSRDCRIAYEYGPFQRFSVTSKEEEKRTITGKEKPLQHD